MYNQDWGRVSSISNLPEYNIEFTNLLKKPPFPGTLNILLESENLEDFYYTLSQQQYHTIEGFQSDARSFW